MASTLTSIEITYFPFPIFLLLPLLFLIITCKISRSPPLPPGPKPWPIIGNLPHMGDKPHVTLARLAKAHGPLMSLRVGTLLVIVGTSPAAAIEILKTHDRILTGRQVPHASFTRDPDVNLNSIGWTFECTNEWKSSRARMKSEVFTTRVINSQSNMREKKVVEMIHFLSSKQGDMVKIREVLYVSTFNTLANIYFSKDFIDFEGEESTRVSELVGEMIELWGRPNISDLYPILRVLDLQGLRRKADKCVSKLRVVWDNSIRERRESKGGRDVSMHRDFLDVLLDSGHSDEQISFIFVEILAAVADGSTSTLEWSLAELIKNPEAMKKIHEELAQEIPEGFIRESHLVNLPYLHACVKETLRLHPTAPFLLPRRAIEDCKVMNYTIPKNSKVLVNVWAIARDPTIWQDPLSFRPQRFLKSSVDFKGNDFEYLPFGSGRRICIALPMAVRHLQLVLANLIDHFEWSLPNNMLPHDLDMNEKFGITLKKEQPLMIIPNKGNNHAWFLGF